MEIFIENALTYLLVNAKIPLFIAVDSSIVKIFTIYSKNEAFLKWLCAIEWWLIKGIIRILLFICFLVFVYWVISKNLIQYLFQQHEEFQSKDFENFQKVRRKRWVYSFLLFFLANPFVLTGQYYIYVPFNHLSLWIIDPYFVKKEYFLKDGYYDDFLYIHIPTFLEKNWPMVQIMVRLYDDVYIQTIGLILKIIIAYILYKFYHDWIFLFDSFISKNVRKTSTFKELINEFRYWKETIMKIIIMILPFSKDFFFFYKKKIDRKKLRILDEYEYEEFHKTNIASYYRRQVLTTNLILVTENFFLESFNRPKKELL